MNTHNLQRIILIAKTIKELHIRDEVVHLEDVARITRVSFITLIQDIHDAIELNIMGITYFRKYNVRYTQFVKRYTKSRGVTYKPVKYFGEWEE